MGEGVPTLDWGEGVSALDGEGYLPWMDEGVPTLDREGVPTLGYPPPIQGRTPVKT